MPLLVLKIKNGKTTKVPITDSFTKKRLITGPCFNGKKIQI
jgi:hypothetical protein